MRPVKVASRNSAPCRSAWSSGNVGAPLVAQRGDAGRVEPGREADLMPPLGQGQRLVEQRDDLLGDRDPLGGRGGVGIGLHGIGHDRDAHGVGIRVGRADVAARGFDRGG